MGTSQQDIKTLLSKYANDTISNEEIAMLTRLLKDGTTEKEVKRILDSHWKELLSEKPNAVNTLPNGFFEELLEKAKKRESVFPQKQNLLKSWYQVAAFFIGIVTTSGLLYFLVNTKMSNPVERRTSTEIGERKTVVLPDGSKVTLNAASTLRYPETFRDTLREIQVTGEAFFEVTKNEKQPFVVKTGNVKTRVLGTSFNIKAHQGDAQVQVSVATGTVKVSSSNKDVKTNKPSQTLILEPGEQAEYSTITGNLTKNNIDTTSLSAWKDGILIFENTPLKNAIKTLERWYKVDIKLENNNIADCPIRSTWDNADLDAVLKTFQFILNTEYEEQNGQVTIRGGACSSETIQQ